MENEISRIAGVKLIRAAASSEMGGLFGTSTVRCPASAERACVVSSSFVLFTCMLRAENPFGPLNVARQSIPALDKEGRYTPNGTREEFIHILWVERAYASPQSSLVAVFLLCSFFTRH